MADDDLRVRERAQDLSAARITVQNRIVQIRAGELNSASRTKRIAFNALMTARKVLSTNCLPPSFEAPLAQNLAITEYVFKGAELLETKCKTTLVTESQVLARFEAIYANLSDTLKRAEVSRIEREHEAEIDERIPGLVAQLVVDTTPASAAVRAELPLSSIVTANTATQNGADGQRSREHQNSKTPTESERREAPKTVRSLNSDFNAQGVKLSRVDSWKRLEDCGMRLELTLSSGVPVVLALTRAAGDQLNIRISRDAAPRGFAGARLKQEIGQALRKQGLNIKEISIESEV